jgi:hypothetical protein
MKLLNAEQLRADGVEEQRAAAADHRAHQAVEHAGRPSKLDGT